MSGRGRPPKSSKLAKASAAAVAAQGSKKLTDDQLKVWHAMVQQINKALDQNEKSNQTLMEIEEKRDKLPILTNITEDNADGSLAKAIADLEDVNGPIKVVQELQRMYEMNKQVRELEKTHISNALTTLAMIAKSDISAKGVRRASVSLDTTSTSSDKETATNDESSSTLLKKRKRAEDADSRPKRGKSNLTESSISIGSQVAFRLRKYKGGEEEWIQCEVTKILSDGNRFEVRDPEPDEHGNPGESYKASIKDVISIHLDTPVNSLTPYSPRTQVLARYPETTTFYRAEVIGTKRDGKCRLRFEGEEEVGKETEVDRRLVLPLPKS